MKKLGMSLLKVRVLASIALICMWAQLFLWFRLFDSLAQYVDLIFTTVNDIGNFMKVLVALVFMFMTGFYMIEVNRLAADSEDASQVFHDYEGKGSLAASGMIS
mmetsp:Transcript_15150/g.20560  ORF Transcript_15150/g.20560 Transcript_15150/m.20560 type:complete len:104 (-) Transcript_15150:131-442(-)